MNSIQSTLVYLYGLQKFGVKLGLGNTRKLLQVLGNPHGNFPSVHVAGTNGKGSTSSMIAASLSAAGYRVGLYTSPHLVSFNERIRIDGIMIADGELVRYTNILKPAIDALMATFFEATTAIAFKYFSDKKIDIGVIETGLGGRLDATNVLTPCVSVITSVGKDHTEQLGSSLSKIAAEKGGIIKRNVACVSGVRSPAARQVLARIAKRKEARFLDAAALRVAKFIGAKTSAQVWDVHTKKSSYVNLSIPLLGRHQIDNATVALVAIEELRSHGFTVPPSAIKHGFRRLHHFTGIRGRFEILQRTPTIVLDVGHNPDGISATVEALKNFEYEKLLLVFGVMQDKDYRTMIRILSRSEPAVFAVHPDMERALPSREIVEEFRKLRCTANPYDTVRDGLHAALRTLSHHDLLLVCGSHYVCGEALPLIEGIVRGKSS